MAIEKLFNVLVIGGVALGTQACKKKDISAEAEKANTVEVKEATAAPDAAKEEVEPAPDKVVEPSTPPSELSITPSSVLTVNSKGEKCEDICSGEGMSMTCADMCCWLQAVECCPNYSAPPSLDPVPEESKGEE